MNMQVLIHINNVIYNTEIFEYINDLNDEVPSIQHISLTGMVLVWPFTC